MFTARWWASNLAVTAGGVALIALIALPRDPVVVALELTTWALAGVLYIVEGEA